MKVIIDIPDDIVNYIKTEHICMLVKDGHTVAKAIFNSIPFEEVKTKIEEEKEKSLNYPNWEYSKGLCKAIEIIDECTVDLKGEKQWNAQ